MEEIAWNFACRCILTTFRTDEIMITVCWFFSFWHYFDSVKWVKFGVSGHFGCAMDLPHHDAPLTETGHIWGFMCGSKCQGGSGGIFPMLCIEFCLACENLVQDCSISIANALEILQSSTKPLIYSHYFEVQSCKLLELGQYWFT